MPGTRLPFTGPPPRAHAQAGWAQLILRGFLGVTFTFAGLQKLADPNFFNPSSSSGIYAQLLAANRTSPLHFLLGHLLRFSTPLGAVIAVAELAIGLGTLLGLWTRLAALGGMVLSLSLFLTVSYHSSPYYTGADIAFIFAWTPLLVAGAAGVLSVDGLIADRAAEEAGEGPPVTVPVPFSVVQSVCGNFDRGGCAAKGGQPCAVSGCPFLAVDRAPVVPTVGSPQRRALVLGGTAAVALGVATAAVAGADAVIGRAVGGVAKQKGAGSTTLPGPTLPAPPGTTTTAASSDTTSGSTTSGSTPSTEAGTAIGPLDDVSVGGFAYFTDPYSGNPSMVIRSSTSAFVAFDAVCPHAGCTVKYSSAADVIVCPCHGSEFDPSNGSLIQGPATRGLTEIPMTQGGNGQLYVAT